MREGLGNGEQETIVLNKNLMVGVTVPRVQSHRAAMHRAAHLESALNSELSPPCRRR